VDQYGLGHREFGRNLARVSRDHAEPEIDGEGNTQSGFGRRRDCSELGSFQLGLPIA